MQSKNYNYFLTDVRQLSLTKKYIIYSLALGLTSLVVPLGVQYLVNNLAISGIWLNTLSFLLVLAVGLIVFQIVRHTQLIIIEYFSRELISELLKKWSQEACRKVGHYYFEVFNVENYFKRAYTYFVEIGIVSIFGLITISIFHPLFIVIVIAVLLFIFWLITNSQRALAFSIEESNQKYLLWDKIKDQQDFSEAEILSYFYKRHDHFLFYRKNSFLVSIFSILVHLFLLGVGSFLIKANQLSIGQLVASEIILSGVLISIYKLPAAIDALNGYETSRIKLHKAIKENYVD